MSDDNDHIEKIKDFRARHRNWIVRELPNTATGVGAPEKAGGKPRLALRPLKITPRIAAKIEEFRKKATAEGIELDVQETGPIVPLKRPRRT